jgi:hypothetical protein
MFRHVALFRFIPESTPEQRLAVLEGLRSLPAQIPELIDYRVGPDVGTSEDNFDVAVVADFAQPEHFEVYRDHPAHEAVASTLVRPLLAARAAVQYEI